MKVDSEWLKESVSMITVICSIISVVECAADENDGGLRLVCGAVAASSILNLLTACIQRLF